MNSQGYDPIGAAAQTDGAQVASVEECAKVLIEAVKQLRIDNDIPATDQVSLYVIDAPIVHSTLLEYQDEIMAKANLVDVVQTDDTAGIPMPNAFPQVERRIGDNLVTIAIQPQDVD